MKPTIAEKRREVHALGMSADVKVPLLERDAASVCVACGTPSNAARDAAAVPVCAGSDITV